VIVGCQGDLRATHSVNLLVITIGSTNTEFRGVVRVDELELVTIGVNFEFARVLGSLKDESVGEGSDGTCLVFPGSRSDSRNTVIFSDSLFVDRDDAECSSRFVPFF